MKKDNIHIICGPTAGGKSARALEMAENLNGVIINCDSMQLYDGLPILTAQPSKEDKNQASHELYGVLKPDEVCSAGNWRAIAEPLIKKTLREGKTPIITGGSGLYITALTKGLSPIPDIPDDVRKATIEKQKNLGNPGFHTALKERDPVMAARLNPNNTARLMRAWEVLEHTGKSLSEWQKRPPSKPPENWHFEIHKIIPERSVLYERCNLRFEKMIEAGAIEEVEEFAKTHKPSSLTHIPLTKALGYEPLLAYTEGKITKDDAITHAQGETRRYAKRQVTWFRHQI